MNSSRIITASAFVIKRKNIGEADRMITLFTKQRGKIRVIAKGIRKITSRRGPYLDLFNEVKVTIHQGKNYGSVSEVDMITSRRSALTGWMQMRAAYFILELVDHMLPEDEPQQELYDQLGTMLSCIGTTKDEELSGLLMAFCHNMLTTLGYLSPTKKYSSFSELVGYIERITERKMRSLKFFSS